ncbi:MAG: phosphate ABC transporter permease subunit PstC [bacterium]|nr:phosphate ABC transporter permease subunit PstC [bacterium]
MSEPKTDKNNAITESLRQASQRTAGFRTGMEWFVYLMLLLCALVSIITTIGIVAILLSESIPFFSQVGLTEFAFGTEWSPLFEEKYRHFGVLPLVCGTALVTVGAALFAMPTGLGAAIYLSEYAAPWFRSVAKPLLEILAGIPSVVYGYLAVVLISPIVVQVGSWLGFEVSGLNALSAAIVVGVMILPTIISLSEDALRAVPRSLREGAYALGSTKLDVTVRVVTPAAFSGIIASFLLAISRAIGETMAVTLAAGMMPQLTLNPLDSVQTMTAFIVEVSKGESPRGSLAYQSIFAVGLTLFIFTMVMNLAAIYIRSRIREKYE